MKRILAVLLAAAILAGGNAFAQSRFRVPAPTVGSNTQSNIRNWPTYIDARVLAAGVSEAHTIPSGAKWVLFSSDCNFYAKPGATAAVPAADVTDGTASEQNPAAWFIEPGTTQIALIAATTCTVTLAFYL